MNRDNDCLNNAHASISVATSSDNNKNIGHSLHEKNIEAISSNCCESVLYKKSDNSGELLHDCSFKTDETILNSYSFETDTCDSFQKYSFNDNKKEFPCNTFQSQSYERDEANKCRDNGKILNSNNCHIFASVLPPQSEISCQQAASSSLRVGSSPQQVAFSQTEARAASKNQSRKDNAYQVENQQRLSYSRFPASQTESLNSNHCVGAGKQNKLEISLPTLNRQSTFNKSNSLQLGDQQSSDSSCPSYTTLQKSSSFRQAGRLNNRFTPVSASNKFYRSNNPTHSSYQGNKTPAKRYPSKKFDQLMESSPSALNKELTMATTIQNPFDVPLSQQGSLGIPPNSEDTNMVYPYDQQPLSNEAMPLTNDVMPTDLRTHNTLDSNPTNLRTQQETASDLQLCLSDEHFMFSTLGMSPPQNQPLNFSQMNSHDSQIVQELQNAVLEDLAVPSQNAQVYQGQVSQTSSGLPGVSRQNDQWSQLLQGSDNYQEQDKSKQADLQSFFNNDMQSLYQQQQQKQLKHLGSNNVKKEPASPSLALQSETAALKKIKKTSNVLPSDGARPRASGSVPLPGLQFFRPD